MKFKEWMLVESVKQVIVYHRTGERWEQEGLKQTPVQQIYQNGFKEGGGDFGRGIYTTMDLPKLLSVNSLGNDLIKAECNLSGFIFCQLRISSEFGDGHRLKDQLLPLVGQNQKMVEYVNYLDGFQRGGGVDIPPSYFKDLFKMLIEYNLAPSPIKGAVFSSGHFGRIVLGWDKTSFKPLSYATASALSNNNNAWVAFGKTVKQFHRMQRVRGLGRFAGKVGIVNSQENNGSYSVIWQDSGFDYVDPSEME